MRTLATSSHCILRPLFSGLLTLLLLWCTLPAPAQAAAPQLWLPLPAGETWRVLQGYACGSHNSWDRYSLDLVNADGRTRGAPVRAAADGRVWSWTAKSGTLIIEHGGGFYTMYSHMASTSTKRDQQVSRGDVIGEVGDRGAPGTPHLHFTEFTGHGIAASGRQSVALRFADGYDLPEVGGCNQHGSAKLTAAGAQAAQSIQPADVTFNGGEPGHWYSGDLRIDFVGAPAGFSQSWDQDPGGDAPQFKDTDAGYVQLAWTKEGLHTLYVRAWDASGKQTLFSYGPIGYDTTPPGAVAPSAPIRLKSGAATALSWDAAKDDASGIAGYHVYIGPKDNGRADWFTAEPQVSAPALAPGLYYLRVQPIDYAGNSGSWATVAQITSE